MEIQEYLDKYYPKEERKSVKKINLNQNPLLQEISETIKVEDDKLLTGHADFRDFAGLKELILAGNEINSVDLSQNVELEIFICFYNNLTDLVLSNNRKLKKLNLAVNKLKNNLNIFSHLTKLTSLDLGEKSRKCNNFQGTLKSLENCKKLEYLCIGCNDEIKQGLEYLPIEKLTYFGCFGTEYQGMLRPFDYDIKAWKLINYPQLISDKTETIIEQLGKKIRESELTLSELKASKTEKNKRITRLENKIKILTGKQMEIIKFFTNKQKEEEGVKKENEELRRKIQELEKENLRKETKIQDLQAQNQKLKERLQQIQNLSNLEVELVARIEQPFRK